MGKKLASLVLVLFAVTMLVMAGVPNVARADCPHFGGCLHWPSFHMPRLCCSTNAEVVPKATVATPQTPPAGDMGRGYIAPPPAGAGY
jgi:hypothetical protein